MPKFITPTRSKLKFFNLRKKKFKFITTFTENELMCENDFWIQVYKKLIYDSLEIIRYNPEEKIDEVELAINMSNNILRFMVNEVKSIKVYPFISFKYFWNRLAYLYGKLDYEIHHVCFIQKNSFKPTIRNFIVNDEKYRVLILNYQLLLISPISILSLVQVIFEYVYNTKNKGFYGHILRKAVRNKDFRLLNDIKYEAGIIPLKLIDQCQLPQMYFRKNISYCYDTVKNIEKYISKLNDQEKESLYNYIVQEVI